MIEQYKSESLNEQEIYLLITRFLSNQTQSNENELLADWLATSKENEAVFERVKSMWEARKKSLHTPDLDAALANVRQKLEMTGRLPDAPRKRFKLPVLVGSLFLLLIPAIFLFRSHLRSNAIAFKVVETKAGERVSVSLSDGTKITLGPASKIKFPAVFSDTLRQVDLTGEAFFEVTKNPHRPFTVRSGTWETRVLGTKFDLSAYPDDKKMSVALVEGRVAVKSGEKTYHIIPGQQLLLNKTDNQTSIQDFNNSVVAGWVTNKLVFRDVPFGEAAIRLERLYNIKIIFNNKKIAARSLWATFDNEPIMQIMETVKLATGIKYKIEGRMIYIY